VIILIVAGRATGRGAAGRDPAMIPACRGKSQPNFAR
jgi:hypothetical protein